MTRARSKSAPPKPTNAEVAILGILWRDGPSTLRHVRAALEQQRGSAVGHTTALKLVQIMCAKGLLYRDDTSRPQIFRPAIAEQETQRELLRDLLDRAFAGSAKKLVLQLLGFKRVPPAEIREVEELLDRIERGRRQ